MTLMNSDYTEKDRLKKSFCILQSDRCHECHQYHQ